MRRLALIALFLAAPLQAATTVTLLQFSDYHSHAVPFYTEEGERGGIARAIGYLRAEKKRGALVFNGGDMVNKGAPAWSDKYGCAEWPWFNGLVDAMAFGNHEPDYGRVELERCRAALAYPVLSANTAGFEPYRVFERNGVRIGVFAVAGDDFEKLGVQRAMEWDPAAKGAPLFGDVVRAARDTVRALREKEHVAAVVMIGHEHADADERLARAVPGIDLIFGSHSHLRRDLARIDGTSTWFISPFQYLSWISRVELTIEGGRVTAVRGELVPVDASMKPDRRTARRVARMQRELEADPRFRALFVPLGRLSRPLSTQELAVRTVDAMRRAAVADVALSTSSSFRGALPAGTATMELLRSVLPYDNEIVVCEMTGAQLQKVLAESDARSATDSGSFISGRGPVDPGRTYKVAATDYLANVAYKDVFACGKRGTGLRVREELRKALWP